MDAGEELPQPMTVLGLWCSRWSELKLLLKDCHMLSKLGHNQRYSCSSATRAIGCAQPLVFAKRPNWKDIPAKAHTIIRPLQMPSQENMTEDRHLQHPC